MISFQSIKSILMNIIEKGREISLDIRRFDSFEYYFNDDIEFKGREMELQTLIRRLSRFYSAR